VRLYAVLVACTAHQHGRLSCKFDPLSLFLLHLALVQDRSVPCSSLGYGFVWLGLEGEDVLFEREGVDELCEHKDRRSSWKRTNICGDVLW